MIRAVISSPDKSIRHAIFFLVCVCVFWGSFLVAARSLIQFWFSLSVGYFPGDGRVIFFHVPCCESRSNRPVHTWRVAVNLILRCSFSLCALDRVHFAVCDVFALPFLVRVICSLPNAPFLSFAPVALKDREHSICLLLSLYLFFCLLICFFVVAATAQL